MYPPSHIYPYGKRRTPTTDCLLSFRAWDLAEIKKRVTQQIETSSVTAIDGSTCELPVGNYPISVCCHSDVPGCLGVVQETKKAVDAFNKAYFPGQ